jgi:methyl-accepting chemotaxis protein
LIVTMSIAMMWTGVALELIDLAGISLLCGAATLLPQWQQYPAPTALWHTLEVWLLVTACGAAMHWLRRQLDRGALVAARAQAQASGAQAQALIEREQATAERTQSATVELAERTRLQQQVAEQTTALAEASTEVRSQTMSVAAATEQMSHSLAELTRTAQATDQITTGVAAKAHDASDVMRALKASSAEIMAASDVIQAIAEQTNLLALNATIESARAGEAGRGFAVVANEVKDLARQSGENADSITRTLAEVQIQVSAAVDRVSEITASMGELSSHNGALAAAIEEQSASVHQVSQSVRQTAGQVSMMADGIQALERISRVS